jgi:E3 ubiquitin-protein ligase DOA10
MKELLREEPTMHVQKQSSLTECKICLMSEGQCRKDYVVSPCKCSGSCSSVHV